MTDRRKPRQYRHCPIIPQSAVAQHGDGWLAGRHFADGRVHLRWWRVWTPDNKWADARTIQDARRLVDRWHDRYTEQEHANALAKLWRDMGGAA